MRQTLSLLVCALALFRTATAQLNDCELEDLFTGGTLEGEIRQAIIDSQEITVFRNRTVCLSVGPTRGKYSSISLVIEYTCTGSFSCPSGGQGVEQFDFGCDSQGQWSYSQFSDFENGRTTNPTANFDTTLRTDCGACFPVHPGADPPTIDAVTHCHECRGCSNIGQMACYDSVADGCCNVYVRNMCAGNCPPEGTYVIDPDTYVCSLYPARLCEDLGNTAVGGSVMYSEPPIEGGYREGSVASVTCTAGYTGGGDVTCWSGNWTGSLPECSPVDCGYPPDLENGKVMFQTGTTFGAVVTYECDENYLFADDDVKSRTCLVSGSWSDEDIRCELQPDVKDCDPVCKNGGICDTFTGLCVCPPGFIGDDCDIDTSTFFDISGTTQSISLYGCSILLVVLSLLSTIF